MVTVFGNLFAIIDISVAFPCLSLALLIGLCCLLRRRTLLLICPLSNDAAFVRCRNQNQGRLRPPFLWTPSSLVLSRSLTGLAANVLTPVLGPVDDHDTATPALLVPALAAPAAVPEPPLGLERALRERAARRQLVLVALWWWVAHMLLGGPPAPPAAL